MPKAIEPKLFVKTPHRGFIGALNITGPLTYPVEVTLGVASKILLSGIPLFKYNPDTKTVFELKLEDLVKLKEDIDFEKDEEEESEEETSENVDPGLTNMGKEESPFIPAGVELTPPAVEVTNEDSDNGTTPDEDDVLAELKAKYELNEDGTVNRDVIKWGSLSKDQAAVVKADIATINASVGK